MSDVKENLSSKEKWVRGLYMLLFLIIMYVVKVTAVLLAFIQFAITLFNGNPNFRLKRFGGQLAAYSQQVLLYLSYCSETKPFPFCDWPEAQACVDSPHEDDEGDSDDALRERKDSKTIAEEATEHHSDVDNNHDTPAT